MLRTIAGTRAFRALVPSVLSLVVLLGTVAGAVAADKGKKGAAPYVDSATIKERFKEITAEDMQMLRGKKILFASRSFGLNLCAGLKALAREDAKYEFLSSYARYDVFKANGDVGVIPADAFKQANFVHFLATYWPHTKRVEEVEQVLTQKPHEFGKQADVVVIYFHTADPKNFEQYATKMDAMQKAMPNIRFIYVTAGFMDKDKQAKLNEQAHAWSELVRQRYKGKAPLYDLGKILSDDFRCGHGYCPEYSKDPAGVHPNLDAGQTMMAKGFLLVLRDAFKWKPGSGDDAPPKDAKDPAAPSEAKGDMAVPVELLAGDHPDYKAVQAILAANDLTRPVVGVSVVENGRVVKLYLQEGGVKVLPDAIGELTELRVLHLYGDRSLGHPLLEKVSPAIGRCTKLEELLLNQNELRTLPEEIAKLTNLKLLSLADNHLKNLPEAVAAWARKFDPKGLADQKP
ncbi:MAG: leucine-rich repeat domain-containing protein [Planctomycetes bacterium]|nr:leucine-rich repeat domain-containing protein [Planctomycetota bacterium]